VFEISKIIQNFLIIGKFEGGYKKPKNGLGIYEWYLRTPMRDHGHWPRFVRLLLCLLDHPLDVGQQYGKLDGSSPH
jgi:hypothetical protein